MAGEIISERRARSNRNAGRHHRGFAGDFPRNPHLGKKNCELSEDDITRICDVFLRFEETEQSKIFDNAEFGYWKVTVERPLRARGIDPDRAYSPKEIKALKDSDQIAEDGAPVIRRI